MMVKCIIEMLYKFKFPSEVFKSTQDQDFFKILHKTL